jgi:hypothetical protein
VDEGTDGGAWAVLVSWLFLLIFGARLSIALAGAAATISSDALMNPFDGESPVSFLLAQQSR